MKKATSTLFILATLLFGPVYLAHAQKSASIPRIGVLYLGVASQRQLRCIYSGAARARPH